MIDTYLDQVVRSPSTHLDVPAVVRLLRYVRYRPAGVRFSRKNVFMRDGYRCQYCGVHGDQRTLTFDHVLARSRGGPTSWTNIVTCCVACNREKGDRTPAESGMQLACRPTRPHWLPGTRMGVPISTAPDEWRLYLRAA